MTEIILKPSPKAVYLGDKPIKELQLGGIKVWPTCSPTVAGIAINVLEATVKEPATGPVTVDWGDGSTPEVLTPSGGEVVACHHYATPGVRRVLLSGAVTKNQKVNAGVVPATTIQVVHGFAADGSPELVYQWANSGSAGRDTKEATAYCDGVFRYHLWFGDPTPTANVYAAFDVSCRGTWWDITGYGNTMLVSRLGQADFTDVGDYKFLSQVYVDGVANNIDAVTYWMNNRTFPGTTQSNWGTDRDYPALTLFGSASGKLITVNESSADSVTQCRLINKDSLLDEFGDPAGSSPGALPPGLDLTMMPNLFAA